MNSQKAPHTSLLRASYRGVFSVLFGERKPRIIESALYRFHLDAVLPLSERRVTASCRCVNPLTR